MRWVGVPDGSAVYIVPVEPLYPAVGGPDDLTDVLDHWAETHTGAIVIDRLDNENA